MERLELPQHPQDKTCLHASSELPTSDAGTQVPRDEFDELLLPLEQATGSALNEPTRSTCRAAFAQHPAGFRAAVDDVLGRRNLRNPVGLLVTKVQAGEIERADHVAPTEPEFEPKRRPASPEELATLFAGAPAPRRVWAFLENPDEVLDETLPSREACEQRIAELRATGRVVEAEIR